jgi:hypothetical protein
MRGRSSDEPLAVRLEGGMITRYRQSKENSLVRQKLRRGNRDKRGTDGKTVFF